MPGEPIQRKLLASAPRDIEELLPHLEPRAEELGGAGHREASEARRAGGAGSAARPSSASGKRVREELEKHEGDVRAAHPRVSTRRRSASSNPTCDRGALGSISSTEISRPEPQRIREFYEVRAKRVEPVGLVYLWPETN